jgi:Concanavalin A-like lectin/glucanases superfamily
MAIVFFKIVVRDDSGDFDQYGTDDVEVVMRLLAGVLSGDQPQTVFIKTEQGWEWFPETSPVWLRDTDESNVYRLKTGNLSGDYDLTIPAIDEDSNVIVDSIVNQFLDEQKYDKQLKLKPIPDPTTDAAYGQIYPDSGDSNKLKYKNPAGVEIDLTAAAGASAPTNATYITVANEAALSNERAMGPGDGVSLVDGGAGSSITPNIDVIDLARKRVTFIDDCFGINGNSSVFIPQASGTGAGVTNLAVTETGVFGVWGIETGTTSGGSCGIRSGNLNSFSLGQGVTVLEFKLKIPVLSTALEQYVIRIGFADANAATPTDSVLFRYDTGNSTFWQLQTKNNTVETLQTTASTVGTGWTRLKIIVNAAANSVSFYIDGTQVANSPITTNIPVGAGRELSVVASINKNVGTTSRFLWVDYSAMDIKLTSPR